MKEFEFMQWLNDLGIQENTIHSRLCNLKKIEKSYGNVDDLIESGKIEEVLNELNYTSEDKRNNRPKKHKIEINGDIYNSTATLRSALNRYMDFYLSTPFVESAPITPFKAVFEKLKMELSLFKGTNPRTKSYKNKVDILLQQPMLELLKEKFPAINWEIEYKLDSNKMVKDRVDIYGEYNDNSKIIIELDTVRSDQVAKKFVSRMALTSDVNTIFISFCYPNTNSNSKSGKKETSKYSRFLEILNTYIGKGTTFEKYYAYIAM